MKKISKRQYILGFGVSVLLLSLVRCFAPDVAKSPIQTKNNMDIIMGTALEVDALIKAWGNDETSNFTGKTKAIT